MTVLTEGQHNLEFFVSEAANTRSREVLTILESTAVYKSGSVLQDKIVSESPTGEYELYDGTGPAAAILYHDVDATAGDTVGVAFVRDIEYKEGKLVFADDATTQHKTDAIADLKALGMIARSSD